MLELIVSKTEIETGMLNARSSLGDVLQTYKKLVSKEVDRNVGEALSRCIDIFAAGYYTIAEKLEQSSILAGEVKRQKILWNYAISCSSTAVLNSLERYLGKNIDFGNNSIGTISPISSDKFKGQSKFSMISNSLSGLRSYLNSSGKGGNQVYKLAFYFTALEEKAAFEAKLACSEKGFNKDLSKLKLTSNLDSFNFRFRKRNARKSNETNENGNNAEAVLKGDKLPDSLPIYDPKNIPLNKVVGNSKVKLNLLENVVKTMHFDPITGNNYFWMEGNGFPEGVLLYGPPGVGKSYMAEAIMHYAVQLAKKHNVAFMPIEMNGRQIASVYQNRSGQLLGHYFMMMREGKFSCATLMDEFDDLIPMGANGDLSENGRQRLSEFKRCTGNSRAKGNMFMIAIANNIRSDKDLPLAILDRFTPIYVPGPQTAAEYGEIIKIGMEYKESKNLLDANINWENVGNHLIEWKAKLDSYNDDDLAIGRQYKGITQQLASSMNESVLKHAGNSLGKPIAQHKKYYDSMLKMISEKDIQRATDITITSLMQSKGYASKSKGAV